MLEVKKGRAGSIFGGIFGLCFAGIALCMFAASAGDAPFPMALVPLFFVIIGVALSAYSFYSAFARNRPDVYDITTSQEEPDPLNQRFGPKKT
jgi:hypothetical protein